MARLHAFKDSRYDIGHYIPTIPRTESTWQQGHAHYLDLLQTRADSISMPKAHETVIRRSLEWVRTRMDSLSTQLGPILLHNDFHPKNIIIRDGNIAGIIDWECSQFGEPDFELSHILHWCIFPPEPGADLTIFTRAFLEDSSVLDDVPDLSTRLTIYQIEHEINQIIWSLGDGSGMRCGRLEEWMAGRIDGFLARMKSTGDSSPRKRPLPG